MENMSKAFSNESLNIAIKKHFFKNIDDVLKYILNMMLDGCDVNNSNKQLIVERFSLKNINELNELINSNWVKDDTESNEDQLITETQNNTELYNIVNQRLDHISGNVKNDTFGLKNEVKSIIQSYKVGFGILFLVNFLIIIGVIFFYNSMSNTNINEIRDSYQNFVYFSIILMLLNLLGFYILYSSSKFKDE
jgi:hypothetical protein